MKGNDLTSKSKFLALILRHKPEAGNITLDANGWAYLTDVTSKAGFTLKELDDIVMGDVKKRYEFNDDMSKIRAVQGHSIKSVEVELEKAIPPGELYHGTKKQLLDQIMKTGLSKMNRHHVHLSADIKTAQEVANRRKGESVILCVDAAFMRAENHKFYLSSNGVWLVDEVPQKFLSVKN